MGWFSKARTWYMHNPLKDWTLHGLSDRECALVLATLSLPEKRAVLLWREDLKSWIHLDHAEAKALPSKVGTSSRARLPNIPRVDDHQEETTAVSTQRKKMVVPREHLRIDMKLSAELIGANQSQKLTTDNVSEGGIKFTERLPDWVAGYFTVVLETPEKKFELTCMLVEDQRQDKMRVAVVETNDEESHLPLYKKWIRSLIDDISHSGAN